MILTSVKANDIILIIIRTEINKRYRRKKCDVVVLKCNNYNFNSMIKTIIPIYCLTIFLRKRENYFFLNHRSLPGNCSVLLSPKTTVL